MLRSAAVPPSPRLAYAHALNPCNTRKALVYNNIYGSGSYIFWLLYFAVPLYFTVHIILYIMALLFRSATESTMEALRQATIRTVAVIAEGERLS